MTAPERNAMPAPQDSTVPAGRVRWAAAMPFLITGLVFASYYVQIPELKRSLELSDGQLGVFLMVPALSGVLSMQVTGRLVARFGSAAVLRIVMVAMPASLLLIAATDGPLVFAGALLLFGAVDGLIDVSMNTHAVAVESVLERPVMNGCHAAWSIGGAIGSVLGGVAIKAGLPLGGHFLIVALSLAVIAVATGRHLLPAEADRVPRESANRERGRRQRAGWTRRVLLLGVTSTVVLVCSGVVGNWSGIFLRDDLGATGAVAALGFIAFSVCEAGVRLVGDRLNSRYGASSLVRVSGAVAVAGLATVVFSPTPAVAITGFALLGSGLSVLAPVIFSVVGHDAADSGASGTADALAKVSSLTYSGMLLGPMAVGWFAEGFGLTATLAGLLALLTLSLALGLRRV